MKRIFQKAEPRTIQTLERDFNMAAIRVGSIDFEVRQHNSAIDSLESEKTKLLSKMKQLSEEGRVLHQKINSELANKIEEGAAKNEIN